jgi:MFS transporter, OFA family, oxalate/formate antiporter
MTNGWIQLLAAMVAMIMIANLQYAWTLFVEPLRNAMGWKLSQVQWGFTLFILFETWTMPLEGWLIDRMGPRWFLTAAGVLCGVGWTALSQVTTLTQLYVFYSIAGIGAAFVYGGAVATALKWFPYRRGFASGLIAAGFGSGSALFMPAIAHLIATSGYQQAFMVTGIAQGLMIIVAAQFLRDPSHAPKSGDSKPSPSGSAAPQFTTVEMLRTPRFYVMYLMFVLMATGGLLVTANAASLAKEWKIGAAGLTLALTLDRLSNGGGRVFWGWISDRIGRERTMAISFFLQALCLLFLLQFGHLSGYLFAAALVLTYFTWGQIFALFPSLTADCFGTKHAASNYSFLYTAKGVASLIGGGLAALLFERFGSWAAPIYVSAVMAGLAALLAVMLPAPQKVAVEPVRV